MTALEFTEEMKGYVAFGEQDFDRGYRRGREEGTYLMFHLTIAIEEVERFIADPEHEAPAVGYVECEALGGRLAVEAGVFNLFVVEGTARRRRMRYRLPFRDGAGHPLTLSGFKVIEDDPGADLWDDTTTLFTTVLAGHPAPGEEASAEPVAVGLIRIHVLDFLRQLTTFRTTGPSVGAELSALGAFGELFLGELWEVYKNFVGPRGSPSVVADPEQDTARTNRPESDQGPMR